MKLIYGISAPQPAVRANSADALTDIVQHLPEQDAVLLARLLVRVRLAEPDLNCRESQLHALAELAEWHDLSPAVLDPLATIRGEAVGSEIEYLDYLLDHVT
jgi:hypothetical protein